VLDFAYCTVSDAPANPRRNAALAGRNEVTEVYDIIRKLGEPRLAERPARNVKHAPYTGPTARPLGVAVLVIAVLLPAVG
jgi:hypothetical protein